MEFEKYPKQYWHCYLQKRKPRGEKHAQEAYVNDLDFDRIMKEIILPWRESRRFSVAGLIVQDHSEVEKIQVVQTDQTCQFITDSIYAQNQNSGMFVLIHSRRVPFYQGRGNDLTTDLLFSHTQDSDSPKFAANGELPKSRLERSFIRSLLNKILKSDSDFDAFCLDKFEKVFYKFPSQMDRVAKLNILLQEDLDQIYEALKSMYPDEVKKAGG